MNPWLIGFLAFTGGTFFGIMIASLMAAAQDVNDS